MILEGENAVLKNRELMGATDPKNAKEGTIRKLYGISIDKNSVHGSDSVDNAKMKLTFFSKNNLFNTFIIASEKALYSSFAFFFLEVMKYYLFFQYKKNFFKIIFPSSSFSLTKCTVQPVFFSFLILFQRYLIL